MTLITFVTFVTFFTFVSLDPRLFRAPPGLHHRLHAEPAGHLGEARGGGSLPHLGPQVGRGGGHHHHDDGDNDDGDMGMMMRSHRRWRTGVQNMDICTKKYIGQILFRWTVWA